MYSIGDCSGFIIACREIIVDPVKQYHFIHIRGMGCLVIESLEHINMLLYTQGGRIQEAIIDRAVKFEADHR